MPEHDQLTLELQGDVTLEAFASSVATFEKLLAALTRQFGGRNANVEWIISGLEYGSATATVTGSSPDMAVVFGVVDNYVEVPRALATHATNVERYSEAVVRQARNLLRVLGDGVTGVRFVTPADEVTVTSSAFGEAPGVQENVTAFGAVVGRVQTLSDRGGVRFTLVSDEHKRAVYCYLDEDRRDILRDAWGEQAIVEGLVTRDSETGRPLSIRKIRMVRVENRPDGHVHAFAALRGIWKDRLDAPSEVIIRQNREVR